MKEISEMKLEEMKLEEMEEVYLNIDMINGFLRGGNLHSKYIERVVGEQTRIMDHCLDRKQLLMLLGDAHRLGDKEFEEYLIHALEHTWESQLIDEFIPYQEKSIYIPKREITAINVTLYRKALSKLINVKMVVGMGCLTEKCVQENLIDTKNFFDNRNQDVKVVGVMDAIETYYDDTYKERTEKAYETMTKSGIILVKNFEELKVLEKQFGLTKKIGGRK